MAGVFGRFGTAYLQRFGDRMPHCHRRAMWAIESCRTPALGAQVLRCPTCERVDYVYHSCRHRACPKCSNPRHVEWLEARRSELLPVPYVHVTFTIPKSLRSIFRTHQRKLYGVLMKAAAQTLMELCEDPQFLGARIGVLAVLHTWTRTLVYHPHVHCLVPAGGLDAEGRWKPARKRCLVPGQVLAKVFRGKLLAMAREAVPDVEIPGSAPRSDWVVHVDVLKTRTEQVVAYLARYIHRTALTDRRIVRVGDEQVSFRYRDKTRKKWRTMRLHGTEFIRRFLQHVLAKGFHRVRYYGLWSPGMRKQLRRVRASMAPDPATEPASPADSSGAEPTDAERSEAPSPPPRWLLCPDCSDTPRIIAGRIDRDPSFASRGPP